MSIRLEILQIFDTSPELDEFVADIFIEELQKPGLILLPVGNTFEEKIYPKVNEFFSKQENKFFEGSGADSCVVQKQIHPELRISHLDELINSSDKFSDRLRKSLPDLISGLQDRFYAIDVTKPDDFDRFIKKSGGPRAIFLGLGEDPGKAHVAFIGEEYINTCTTEVELGLVAATEHKCSRALTIGVDVFAEPNVEKIIVVVKGKTKSKALQAAFSDPDTGLGYLIKYHSNKLKIYADASAALGLKSFFS